MWTNTHLDKEYRDASSSYTAPKPTRRKETPALLNNLPLLPSFPRQPKMADHREVMGLIKRRENCSYPVLTPNMKGYQAAVRAGEGGVVAGGREPARRRRILPPKLRRAPASHRLRLARKKWPSSALRQRGLAGATSIAPSTNPSSGTSRLFRSPSRRFSAAIFFKASARNLPIIALPFLRCTLAVATDSSFRFQDVAEAAQKDNVRVRGCVSPEVPEVGMNPGPGNAFSASPFSGLSSYS